MMKIMIQLFNLYYQIKGHNILKNINFYLQKVGKIGIIERVA